jgi:hypothetical protein
MKLDDRHIAWLRAQLNGQEVAMREIMGELSEPGDVDPLSQLIYHAFVIAVRRVFGTQFTHGEVVRLVADERAALGDMHGLVDPVAAESEIRRALGERAVSFPDPVARATAQLTTLDYLVRGMELSDAQVDELLCQARYAASAGQPG